METYRGVVYPEHLDHMGHMNVRWYTAKFDEATWHLFAAMGLTPKYFRTKQRGMAAVEQTTRYKSEAFAGDLVSIQTEVLELKERSVRFVHVMYDAVERSEIATSEIVGVHLDREHRQACPFPSFVYEGGDEAEWRQRTADTSQSTST